MCEVWTVYLQSFKSDRNGISVEIKEGQTLTEKSQIVTGDALSVLRRISDNYAALPLRPIMA